MFNLEFLEGNIHNNSVASVRSRKRTGDDGCQDGGVGRTREGV